VGVGIGRIGIQGIRVVHVPIIEGPAGIGGSADNRDDQAMGESGNVEREEGTMRGSNSSTCGRQRRLAGLEAGFLPAPVKTAITLPTRKVKGRSDIAASPGEEIARAR
jgi:hypothetical protein